MTARSCGPRSRPRCFPGSRLTSPKYSHRDSRQPHPLHFTPKHRGIEAGDRGDLDRPPWREEAVVVEGPQQRYAAAAVRQGVEQRVGNGAQEEKRERPPVAAGDEGEQRGAGEGEDDRMREAAMTVRRAVRDAVAEAERVDVRKNRGDDGGDGHARGRVSRAQEGDSGMGEDRRHAESMVTPDFPEWAA